MVTASDAPAAETETTLTWAADPAGTTEAVTVTMSQQNTLMTDIRFADQEDIYSLYVTPRLEARKKSGGSALIQMAPWLLLVMLVFSLFCALVYSRYITRPILRLSGIAGKWRSWISAGNAQSSAKTKLVPWGAVWISWPAGFPLP